MTNVYVFFKKKFVTLDTFKIIVANINSKATIKIKTRHFDMFLYICLLQRRNAYQNIRNNKEKKENFQY